MSQKILASKEAKLEGLRSRLISSELALSETRKLVRTLKSSTKAYKAQVEERNNLVIEVESLESQKYALEAEISALRGQIKAADRIVAKIKEVSSRKRAYASSRLEAREMISEGLEDWAQISKARKEAKERRASVIVETKNKFGFEDDEQAIAYLAKKAKKKAIARSIGLDFWPALYHEGCDPMAFVHAERVLKSLGFGSWGEKCLDSRDVTREVMNHGGWDSKGDRGIDPAMVGRIWFACGCRPSEKFRKAVSTYVSLKNRGSDDRLLVNYTRHPQKSETAQEYGWLMTAVIWFTKNKMSGESNRFSRKALIAIGRISAHLRWAAISGLDLENARNIRVRDLNWQAVDKCQKSSRAMVKYAHAPSRALWFALKDQDRPSGLPRTAKPGDVSEKAYLAWCAWGDVAPWTVDQNPECLEAQARGCAWRLAKIFRTIPKRAYRGTSPQMDLHNLGQFPDPEPGYSKEWEGFCLKFGTEGLLKAGLWVKIEQELGRVPVSLAELREACLKYTYSSIPQGHVETAHTCARLEMPESRFLEYCKMLDSRAQKTAESIPAVSVSNGDYTLETMDGGNDPLAPLLGMATNCCQHPWSAGRSCAWAIRTHERAGAWVMRKAGTIIAQSYLWRGEDTVVIDSVESLSTDYVKEVAFLIQSACKKMVGRLGVKSVHIGRTNFGITSAVVFSMDARAAKQPVLGCPSSYSDAREQMEVRV